MQRCLTRRCACPVSLSVSAISRALLEIPEWRVDESGNGAIHREFVFKDFAQAMTFMNKASADCEALGHHPQWTNTYNKVYVRLTTHDAGNKVTQKDIDLARRMEEACRLTVTHH